MGDVTAHSRGHMIYCTVIGAGADALRRFYDGLTPLVYHRSILTVSYTRLLLLLRMKVAAIAAADMVATAEV